MAALIVEPLVATINEELLDVTLFEENKKIELAYLMESYEKIKLE